LGGELVIKISVFIISILSLIFDHFPMVSEHGYFGEKERLKLLSTIFKSFETLNVFFGFSSILLKVSKL
jgi:hypothetical protein